MSPSLSPLHAAIRRDAVELQDLEDVAPIVELIGDACLVLLGESTHGSHEFYRLRAELTQCLIAERGFDAVAVEADWPDALGVSRFLRGDPKVRNVEQALAGFTRFPRWMWRNAEVRDFVQWLRGRNDAAPQQDKVLFYGLDLYSLGSSIESVLDYLRRTDPALARQARERYACFDGVGRDPQRYGQATRHGLADDCEAQAVQQLQEMFAQAARLLQEDGGPQGADELFYAQQNARVVQGAERYYREMYRSGRSSWNLRDTHMADTLDALRQHLGARRGRPARLVVWAHNSHIGDARATQMGDGGELNLGQLVRERHPGQSFLLGFTSHHGSVAAAPDWDEPVEHMRLRPSLEGSVERLLHDSGLALALVPLRGALREPLAAPRLERAVGVIYRPDTERWSHCFQTRLSDQFDAIVHVDRTRALTPLDRPRAWQPSSEEETFPTGL